MIDHIGVAVSDYERSKAFYARVLAPLGYALVHEVTAAMTGSGGSHAGFGLERRPQFWIQTGDVVRGTLHVAFAANTRAQVDAFHLAALGAGATDHGAPGLRPHYHPIITARSCSIPTGTTSKPCATRRSRPQT
jgi:catechol 2,3-dioxygenase-like lactoylglutathione lyase family enzyme